MAIKKDKNNLSSQTDNNLNIKESIKSSLSDFIKRPLPTDKEVEEFDQIIEEEIREGEVDEGLSEIYQDDDGGIVDIGKFDVKNKKGFMIRFVGFLFILAVLASIGFGFYHYIFSSGSDATAIKLFIEGEESVSAGEEFFYTIIYRNTSNIKINNAILELTYPKNFVFLDSSPSAQEKKSVWNLGNLEADANSSIKIKGKIIGEEESSHVLSAKMTYVPENFSSDFKKEALFTTKIKNIGIDFEFNYPATILVGEEDELSIKLEAKKDNFLQQFKLVADLDDKDNIEIISVEAENIEDNSNLLVEKIKQNVWQISGISDKEREIIVKYKFNEKMDDKQNIVLYFMQEDEDGNEFIFFEKKIEEQVMKSDLNLVLIINGSKEDQPVDFNQKLNYSITYINKGEINMKDVVIMAVLESNFLDWASLEDNNTGREKGNTITWSKEEISALEELGQEEEGVIDFSIDVTNFKEADLGKNFEIKNYVQFSIGNIDEFKGNIDNQSNTIINKINSDLSIKEEIRYFNEDNIPVGTGPLPPKVGETTSFKVYWILTNNLHELRDASVEVDLPSYVSWDSKNRTSVGVIQYDAGNHKVVWKIGRLPTSVYRTDAEFNISITPGDDDRNKIMVLLSGSKLQAVDNETGATINKSTKAKTTKLEDDEIATIGSDGRVE